jgi:hypothetical protein
MAPAAAITEKNRAKRAKKTAEVFTPDDLACEMLAKLPKEVWRKGKTFCDPAVGNGQFLIWALIKKISAGHDPLEALGTLYGADIFNENVNECRLRLLKIAWMCGEKITEEHVRVVLKNLFWCQLEVYPRGSLDYDFEFNHEITKESVKQYMDWIKKGILEKKNARGDDHVRVPSKEEFLAKLKKWFK